MDPVKAQAILSVAMGLITSGAEIYQMLKSGEELTDEQIQAIIDRENEEQAIARAKIKEILDVDS